MLKSDSILLFSDNSVIYPGRANDELTLMHSFKYVIVSVVTAVTCMADVPNNLKLIINKQKKLNKIKRLVRHCYAVDENRN